jgi:hypothetical protein
MRVRRQSISLDREQNSGLDGCLRVCEFDDGARRPVEQALRWREVLGEEEGGIPACWRERTDALPRRDEVEDWVARAINSFREIDAAFRALLTGGGCLPCRELA